MALDSFVFLGAIGTLLGTPVTAPFVVRVASRKAAPVRKRFYLAAAICLVLVGAAIALDISFSSFKANAIASFAAYICFGILTFGAFYLKPRPLGLVVGIACTLPLIGGVLLSTIGILGLVFIIGDAAPAYEARLENGTTCRITMYGNATTSTSGRDIAVSKPIVPGIERQIFHKSLVDEDPYLSDENVCQIARHEIEF